MSEVLQEFQKRLSEWTKLQSFIEKTQNKQGKFSESVIKKLVGEFEVKQNLVREGIEPLVSTMEESLGSLRNDLQELKTNNSSYDEVEQELTLRHEIGALEEEEYQLELNKLRSSMSGYAEKLDVLNAGIESISAGLSEWYSLRGESDEVESVEEIELKEDDIEESEIAVDIQTTLAEDLDDALPPVPFDEDESEDFEVSPRIDDFEVASPEDFASPLTTLDGEELNFDLSDNDLGFEESVEFSSELISPDEFSSSIEISSIDLMENPLLDEPRTAILLRDEGTPNEAVFPFQGDIYEIGRSAENNIQIKGDNKVSRMHCKLTRRDNQFYIQDLGSSNGTVVDGELIHEDRKLLGGEELKVGETIFRFQIQ
jgi:hypothetical protein